MTDLAFGLTAHKTNAEKLFTACAFSVPDEARRSCGWLQPSVFTDHRYAQFWQAVLDGQDASGAAMDAGIYSSILGSMSDVISVYDFETLARTINEDAYYLSLAKQLSPLSVALEKRNGSKVAEITQAIGSRVMTGNTDVPDIVDIAGEFLNRMECEPDVINTGFLDIDRYLGGIERKTVTMWGARPGMGKTAALLNIARNVARTKKVGFFSLEMSRIKLFQRMACGDAKVDWRLARNGKLEKADKDRLYDATSAISEELEDRLRIDDTGRITMDEIWRRCARHEFDMVIIDHLALAADTHEKETLRLGKISWLGKLLAKELDCSVHFAVQLNRGVEQRQDKRPMLSDLRDSGELEQNADNVIMLYRDDYYKDDNKLMSESEFTVVKHRDGASGKTIEMMYDKKRQQFHHKASI
jgi:replicative DNA helicase